MTAQLVTDALMMDIWRRGKPLNLLQQSDQGSQCTSAQFQRLIADHGITCSMSRSGNIWEFESVRVSGSNNRVLFEVPLKRRPTAQRLSQAGRDPFFDVDPVEVHVALYGAEGAADNAAAMSRHTVDPERPHPAPADPTASGAAEIGAQ